MLKPNGNVFDEIRNFFIDGEWVYSVYTDGVDYEGFWEQPAGKLKEACKKPLRCICLGYDSAAILIDLYNSYVYASV